MSMNLPLPDGWIQEFDSSHNHPYWVDTKADPPRAIWVHPYEDEQFLNDHPDIQAKIEKFAGSSLLEPPPYTADTRRHSYSGGEASSSKPHDSSPVTSDAVSSHDGDSNSSKEKKRGMFGKLKDKAIGSKAEREEHKRVKAEQIALMEEQMRQERMRNLEERAAYMRQHGGYAPYHPSYGGFRAGYPGYSSYGGLYGPPVGAPSGFGGPGGFYGGPTGRFGGPSGGFGGAGAGAGMLLGGLAGGLLLGDMIGGGF
ncbi:hypothetical protein HYDPIDRAFT_106804 [Hydnomerulius pinastri MD-312]|nr:hypothetical protein HYDPIDRAFT_106804 [Hydnomerulius pinastri MD-312]